MRYKPFVKENIALELFQNTIKNEETGCWEWQRPGLLPGYGTTTYGGKRYTTHRLSAYLWNGLELNDSKLHVCHTCDNPACWNPDHLVVADHQWNMSDAVKKGRMSQAGVIQPGAKLNEATVVNLKKDLIIGGISQKQLSKKYGISESLVSAVKHGKKWKHIKVKKWVDDMERTIH